jgi:hypothetical protein
MMQTTAMTDHFDGDDYNLRLLIERMQRVDSSEREIEMAVRDASGFLSHPASPPWTARGRPPLQVIGRRLQSRGRLSRREEG